MVQLIDPLRGFQIGQAITGSSPVSEVAGGILEDFQTRRKEQRKFDQGVRLAEAKASIKSPTDLILERAKLADAAKTLNRPDIFKAAQQRPGEIPQFENVLQSAISDQTQQGQQAQQVQGQTEPLTQPSGLQQETTIPLTGGIDERISAFKPELDEFGEETQESKLKRDILKADISKDIQVSKEVEAQEQKFRAEQGRNFKIARDKLIRTLINKARVDKKTAELTGGLRPGRFTGIVNKAFELTGANEFITTFQGDLVQTSVALAKIAAPSARVGGQLQAVFERPLPNIFSTEGETKNQVVESIVDAYINFFETNPELYIDDRGADVVPDFSAFEQSLRETVNQIYAEHGPLIESNKEQVRSQQGGTTQPSNTQGRFTVERVS